MYSDWVSPGALGTGLLVIFVWMGILTYSFWRQGKFLNALFPKNAERDIRKKFEEVTETVADFKTELTVLDERVTQIQNKGTRHIQRMELLRFNPYDETGGDISFTVCLLDELGSGVVMTSLHARSGTRVFAKDVTSGLNSKYELSKEEKLVIKKAMEK